VGWVTCYQSDASLQNKFSVESILKAWEKSHSHLLAGGGDALWLTVQLTHDNLPSRMKLDPLNSEQWFWTRSAFSFQETIGDFTRCFGFPQIKGEEKWCCHLAGKSQRTPTHPTRLRIASQALMHPWGWETLIWRRRNPDLEEEKP
jgi:hypothetical protein